jgi:hypothetical protein
MRNLRPRREADRAHDEDEHREGTEHGCRDGNSLRPAALVRRF